MSVLIDNGIKFCGDDGVVEVTVEVTSSESENQSFRIAVSVRRQQWFGYRS